MSSNQQPNQTSNKESLKKVNSLLTTAPSKVAEKSKQQTANFMEKLKEKQQNNYKAPQTTEAPKQTTPQQPIKSVAQIGNFFNESKTAVAQKATRQNSQFMEKLKQKSKSSVPEQYDNEYTYQDEIVNRVDDKKPQSSITERPPRQQQLLQNMTENKLRRNRQIGDTSPIATKPKKLPDTLTPQQIEARNERRRLIQERMQQEAQAKEIKAKINHDGNRLIKQIQESMKMHEKMIQDKDHELKLPELEKHKQELAKKRELSQPIRLVQIKEHQKKYEDQMRVMIYEREKAKQDALMEHKAKVPKFPKSLAQLRVEEDERLEREKKLKEQEQRKQQRVRQQKYVEVVKNMIPVPVPKRIHKESSNSSRSPRQEKAMMVKGFLSGQQNLRKLERALKKNGRSIDDIQVSQRQEKTDVTADDASFFTNKEESVDKPKAQFKTRSLPKRQPIQSSPQIEEVPIPPKKKDYLQELRAKRIENGNPASNQAEEWQRIMKNETLPQNARYQSVLTNVQKLEQRAKEKEKLAAHNNDLDAEEEANNLYINSIKAKLALLEK